MTETEKQYFEHCKDLIPFDTGSSLHVHHEFYHINDKVIELYFAIGDIEPFEIKIYDFATYKTPSEKLQETLNLVSSHLTENKIARLTDAEKQEILETFKWIKVKQFVESDPLIVLNDPNANWQHAYQELKKHHEKETNFLIQKVRDLVKYIDQLDQTRRDSQVFYGDELSDEFKKSINGEVKKVSAEKLKEMRQSYEKVIKKLDS